MGVGSERAVKPPPETASAWLRFLLQFHNPLIYVLCVAGLATLALGSYVDSGVIPMDSPHQAKLVMSMTKR